jgi:hypothetical protein
MKLATLASYADAVVRLIGRQDQVVWSVMTAAS